MLCQGWQSTKTRLAERARAAEAGGGGPEPQLCGHLWTGSPARQPSVPLLGKPGSHSFETPGVVLGLGSAVGSGECLLARALGLALPPARAGLWVRPAGHGEPPWLECRRHPFQKLTPGRNVAVFTGKNGLERWLLFLWKMVKNPSETTKSFAFIETTKID